MNDVMNPTLILRRQTDARWARQREMKGGNGLDGPERDRQEDNIKLKALMVWTEG